MENSGSLRDCVERGHRVEVFPDADGVGGTAVCLTCGATEIGLMDKLIFYQLVQVLRNIKVLTEKMEEKK
jgi:hypothetical protein